MKTTIKIIADSSLSKLMPSDNKDYIIEILAPDSDDAETVEKIACLQPDIVFLNMFAPRRDAVSVINSYSSIFACTGPYFAVMCTFVSEKLKAELKDCGVSHIFFPPYSQSEISNIIMHIHKKKLQGNSWKASADVSTVHKIHEDFTDKCLEKNVDEILLRLGIHEHTAGYLYIKRAIILAVEDENMMYSVTRSLYPAIAQEFGTTPSAVERRIRHAIIVAWETGESCILESYFGNTIDTHRGKPANSEFIAMVADRIKLSMRESSMSSFVG